MSALITNTMFFATSQSKNVQKLKYINDWSNSKNVETVIYVNTNWENSVPIITIQDDDNDYDVHDNHVDTDITRRILSFELCHLQHMVQPVGEGV